MDQLTLSELNELLHIVERDCERLRDRIQMFPAFSSYRDELTIVERIKEKIQNQITSK